MVGTICVHGSDGKIMAPLGSPGVFYPARRGRVRVAEDFVDSDLPPEVQQALQGMEVRVLFFEASILERLHVPVGGTLAYLIEIQEDLEKAGEAVASIVLQESITDDLDILMIPPDQFTKIGG